MHPGSVGGALWHGIKGARNAPRGFRIADGVAAIRLRAPVLGGNFGVWGGVFSVYDCTLAFVRRKEDPWNAIFAGAFTGGTLAARCELCLSWFGP
jgi:import inner membrane translocase subunit TIM17